MSDHIDIEATICLINDHMTLYPWPSEPHTSRLTYIADVLLLVHQYWNAPLATWSPGRFLIDHPKFAARMVRPDEIDAAANMLIRMLGADSPPTTPDVL